SNIRHQLNEAGYTQPLAADIHFNPEIAAESASRVEKIRINPGNFIHIFKGKTHYSDDEYRQEIDETHRILKPIIDVCKKHNTAVRIGINHGSLGKRILSRYGDTPVGMVESAIEYIRIFAAEDFHNLLISMKSSDVRTMIWANRLLAQRMMEERFDYPIHLGVTEAGAGEDGRIKSAIGIGSLLMDGIGDTVRVSLTEAPENEIPVSKQIVESAEKMKTERNLATNYFSIVPPYSFTLNIFEKNSEILPEITSKEEYITIQKPDDIRLEHLNNTEKELILAFDENKISFDDFLMVCGGAFADGIGNGLSCSGRNFTEEEQRRIYMMLQSTRRKISTAEFISCPSCGRTEFDIESLLKDVKNQFSHLKGISIAVMGCIVNGPGEMRGATYGILGSAPGKVHLYYKGDVVQKNIPQNDALRALQDLIREKGDYKDV
ncbi:MAG: flavodoxin-dependent (E)-4-hydroxy-3-methylbut-2-enyl-diphosphate synthase, partial [Bacteroidales bacterium]|nr:flavodoxin-dependent (E)-4-hydroxy-3-methylbut-2-enyl-diphosphate synthase [Bacteroidales bacterium]